MFNHGHFADRREKGNLGIASCKLFIGRGSQTAGNKPDYVWFIDTDATTAERVVHIFAGSATLTVKKDRPIREGPDHVVAEKGTGKYGDVLSVDNVVIGKVPKTLLSEAGLGIGDADATASLIVYTSSLAMESSVYFLKRIGQEWRIVKKLKGPVS